MRDKDAWAPLIAYFDAHYPLQPSVQSPLPQIAVSMSDGTTAWIPSQEGVQQGDPLGPAFFAFGLSEVMHRMHELTGNNAMLFTAAYLDDINLVGSADCLLTGLRAVVRAVEDTESGLKLNGSKCQFYFPRDFQDRREHLQEGSKKWLKETKPPQIVPAEEGILILGTPVGSKQFVRQQLKKVVEKVQIPKIRAMAELPPQYHMLLLRHCGVAMVGSLLRGAHPNESLDACHEHDRAIREGLAKICRDVDEVDDPMWHIAKLPLRLGGLGLVSAKELRHVGFMAATVSTLSHLLQNRSFCRLAGLPGSNEDTLPPGPIESVRHFQEAYTLQGCRQALDLVKEQVAYVCDPESGVRPGLPGLQSRMQNQAQALSLTVEDALQRTLQAPKEKIQRKYAEVSHWAKCQQVFVSMEEKKRPRFQSQMQYGANGWLMAAPSERALQLQPHEFVWSVEKWLGAKTNWDDDMMECTCTGKAHSNKWDHINSCRMGGGLIRRHDNVKLAVGEMCRAAGLTIAFEERAKYEGTGNGGPDITVNNFPSAGVNTFIEVSVTNPTSHAESGKIPLYAAAKACTMKQEKYASIAKNNGMQLRTAVVESPGAFSTPLRSLISEVVAVAKKNGKENDVPTTATWLARSFRPYHTQRISVALRRGAYDMAVSCTQRLKKSPTIVHKRKATSKGVTAAHAESKQDVSSACSENADHEPHIAVDVGSSTTRPISLDSNQDASSSLEEVLQDFEEGEAMDCVDDDFDDTASDVTVCPTPQYSTVEPQSQEFQCVGPDTSVASAACTS